MAHPGSHLRAQRQARRRVQVGLLGQVAIQTARVAELDHQQHALGVDACAVELDKVGVAGDGLHHLGLAPELVAQLGVDQVDRLLHRDFAAAEGAPIDGAEAALANQGVLLDLVARDHPRRRQLGRVAGAWRRRVWPRRATIGRAQELGQPGFQPSTVTKGGHVNVLVVCRLQTHNDLPIHVVPAEGVAEMSEADAADPDANVVHGELGGVGRQRSIGGGGSRWRDGVAAAAARDAVPLAGCGAAGARRADGAGSAGRTSARRSRASSAALWP